MNATLLPCQHDPLGQIRTGPHCIRSTTTARLTFEAEDRADVVMLRGILGGIGGFYRNFTDEDED